MGMAETETIFHVRREHTSFGIKIGRRNITEYHIDFRGQKKISEVTSSETYGHGPLLVA